MGTFLMTLLMNKWTNIIMDDGWVHPLAKTLPSLVNNVWWIVVIIDWDVDAISLGKWQSLRHCETLSPPQFFFLPRSHKKRWVNIWVLVTLHHGSQLVLSNTTKISDTKGHFTHKPRFVTRKLWEPKRVCPKAVPRHLQTRVVWSQILKCSAKSYVTRPSTKCYFNVRNAMVSRFGVRPTSKRRFLNIVQVIMKHDPLNGM